MTLKKINISFYAFLFAYFCLLVLVSNDYSLAIREIDIFYSQENTILWYLTHISTHFLGTNNIGARMPFIILYVLSVWLAYLLSEDYFTQDIDRLISIAIFMLLPGLNSAALLIDNAIVVVFLVLLYLYLYKHYGQDYYILLVLFLFVDSSFAILYLALFFYSIKQQDKILMGLSLILFTLSILIYDYDIGGHPRGYFLDTFLMYTSIFSPIIFLYFFYAMYRVAFKGERDLYWYIAFTSLILSLILSLRQKVSIGDFAPFVIIAVPLMVKLFLHSYRVRLKQFRANHHRFVKIMLWFLILNFFVLFFSKPLYLLIDNPQKHFAYKFHIASELAGELKKLGINKVKLSDEKMQKRLDYYGVTIGNKYFLSEEQSPKYQKKIQINYFGKNIKTYYLLLQK